MYILSERNPINAYDNGVANGVLNGVENTYVFAPANNPVRHSLNHLRNK